MYSFGLEGVNDMDEQGPEAEGWIVDDMPPGGCLHDKPEDAMREYLMEGVELLEGIWDLRGMKCGVSYMRTRTLESEDQRDEALIGLDDEEYMTDLEIGGTYYEAVRRKVYVIALERGTGCMCDEVRISYKPKSPPRT